MDGRQGFAHGRRALPRRPRTNGLDGKRVNPYDNSLNADPDIRRRWDSQYPSLWITHGGGGTFANIWTPDTFAQSGLYISDTTTPGRVYELSAEHHVRTEIKLDQVAHWELYALQTEGERGESAEASSLEISRSNDITIANYHGYRVTRGYHPFPHAILMSHSRDIRFRNVHVDSNSSAGYCTEDGCGQFARANKFSYENCIVDRTFHSEVRDREFAWLNVTGDPPPPQPPPKVERLATGFYNISGAAIDGAGQLYFVDVHWNRIYRRSADTKDLNVVRDNPFEPVNLAFDKSGNLIVVSLGGTGMTVYALRPDGPEDELTVLQPEPAADRPSMTAVLPVSYWVNGDFTNTLDTTTYQYPTMFDLFARVMTTRKVHQYVSPDRSLFIPSDKVFVAGPPRFGYKWAYILQAFGLTQAEPGRPFYVTDESEQRTYRATVNPDGSLSGLKLFAEQGGEYLAQDAAGNVYMAAGQIFVYNPAGKIIDTIPVPERPLDLVFGGKDLRTLFILTHHSLYSLRTETPGL